MNKRILHFFNADTGGASGGGGSTLLAGGVAEGGGQAAASAAVVTPTTFTWAKEDGSFSDGWLEKLPEDLKGNASLKSIGSLPDLAKSYVATKALIGTKLEMPGEGATPEQIAAWRKTVGAPEAVEGYYGEGVKSLRPEVVPENAWNVDSEKKFMEIAHKHHLPPAAVKEILGFYGDSIAEGLKAAGEQQGTILAQEGAKLKAAWGADFDAKLNVASRMALTVGLDPKTNPIFTNADTVQAFAKMAALISEDKLVKGEAPGINGSLQERIRDISDPKSTSQLARAYRNEFGPERQAEAQAQLHQLMTAAASNN